MIYGKHQQRRRGLEKYVELQFSDRGDYGCSKFQFAYKFHKNGAFQPKFYIFGPKFLLRKRAFPRIFRQPNLPVLPAIEHQLAGCKQSGWLAEEAVVITLQQLTAA